MAYSLRVYQIIKCQMCGATIEGEPIWSRIGFAEHMFCSERCAELCAKRGCVGLHKILKVPSFGVELPRIV